MDFILGVVAALVVLGLLQHFFPTYLAKKGENLATKEDIAEITHKIEAVRTEYATVLEELKARHQLRSAALDRRLLAHQEAFTLWRKVLSSAHDDRILTVVIECQEWWEQNCVYLEPSVREAFVAAYSSAHSHYGLVTSAPREERADIRSLAEEAWVRVTGFPDVLFAAVQLPRLSELEREVIK